MTKSLLPYFKVLVEVKAGSLDFVDLKVAKGYDRGLLELVNRYKVRCHNFVKGKQIWNGTSNPFLELYINMRQ